MKLIKNVILLLAMVSFSMSTLPLTTAKAADTSVQPVADESVIDKKTSTVTVTVVSGVLTLDKVPDFNFGTMAKGTTVKLKSNTADTEGFNSDTIGEDGTTTNPEGYLQVTDSRNLLPETEMPGFTLTASMGQLKTANASESTADASESTADASESLDAVLHLSAIPLVDGDNVNVSSTGVDAKTKAASISSGSTAQTVMALKKGEYNAGVIRAQYNTPDSASLESFSNSTGGSSDEPSGKNMNAIITWTLNANPVATN